MKDVTEWSNMFDVSYNNITSNQAPGLNEYEKSVYLTRAENEIVRNYFTANSKGNNLGQGFDDSAVRQMDFSTLLESTELSKLNDTPKMDYRALVYQLPQDVFIIINEEIALKGGVEEKTETTYYKWNGTAWNNIDSIGNDTTIKDTVTSIDSLPKTGLTEGDIYEVNTVINDSSVLSTRQVIPISYQEYIRLMSKPFKEPLKWQAWRLMTKGSFVNGLSSNKIEIVLTSYDLKKYTTKNYIVRYVRKPKPIILEDLTNYGDIKIEGETSTMTCELDSSTHDAILQRAVELAKIAWNGDANETQLQMTSGQRSE